MVKHQALIILQSTRYGIFWYIICLTHSETYVKYQILHCSYIYRHTAVSYQLTGIFFFFFCNANICLTHDKILIYEEAKYCIALHICFLIYQIKYYIHYCATVLKCSLTHFKVYSFKEETHFIAVIHFFVACYKLRFAPSCRLLQVIRCNETADSIAIFPWYEAPFGDIQGLPVIKITIIHWGVWVCVYGGGGCQTQ